MLRHIMILNFAMATACREISYYTWARLGVYVLAP
jgi:hypothetical protein